MNNNISHQTTNVKFPEVFKQLQDSITHPYDFWWNYNFKKKVCLASINIKNDSYLRTTNMGERSNRPYVRLYPSKDPSNHYNVIWNSFDEALQYLASATDDIAIFPGFSFEDRNLLICDVDYSITETTVESVLSLCEAYNLPTPNYLTINPPKNHYQFGWFLNKGFNIHFESEHNLWKRLIKALPKHVFLDADDKYTGSWCRNPYHPHQQTLWFDHEAKSRDAFLNFLSLYNEDSVSSHNSYSNKEINKSTFQGVESSRHQYAVKNLRKGFNNDLKRRGWFGQSNSFIRENYTFEMMMQVFRDLEAESLQFNGKSEIESDTEIRPAVKYLFSSIINDYDEAKTHCSASKDEFNLGNCIKSVNSSINYLTILFLRNELYVESENVLSLFSLYSYSNRVNDKFKYREIAEVLGMDTTSVQNLKRNYSIDKVKDAFLAFLYASDEWQENYKNTTFTDKFQDLRAKVIAIVNELFSDDIRFKTYRVSKNSDSSSTGIYYYNFSEEYQVFGKEVVWTLYTNELETRNKVLKKAA